MKASMSPRGRCSALLIYGNFDGTPACTEHGSGFTSSQYHLHFIFQPTSSGYLEIGGCVLDIATEAWVCNGVTYNKLDYIPNGGGTSDPNNPTPAPGDNPPSQGGGGAHIWDGIVDALVQLSTNTINQYLPAQLPFIGYTLSKAELIIQSLFSILMAVMLVGLSGTFILVELTGILAMEITYWTAYVAVTIGKWIL